ncbi:MAG: HEPN domain-containing protein [Phycisphaerales bacterium]|nr:MAG: HEPN domain-containing protein [Phycisphaerales bacterium]
MTAPRDDILVKVRQWATHADDDLRVAQHTLVLPADCPYRLVAYHAQQCAEKYLKGFLVLQGVDFPYTHNIALLRELCAERAPWSEELRDAEELTPFAIAARYPGNDEPVDEAEARRAVEIAMCVRERVRKALGAEGVGLFPA